LTVATSSARERSASCTAITLWPAFCRIGITLFHEDPSAHKPWTKTIFGVAVVAFALVVVVVVVAFVAVAMPCEASGSIKVLLLFSVLAKPERGVTLAISVVVRNIEIAKLIF
jgi:hypothetical protein